MFYNTFMARGGASVSWQTFPSEPQDWATKGQMDGWIVGRIDALADRTMDGLVGNRRTDRRMDAQIDGWAKGGTDRSTDEQTDDHSTLKKQQKYGRPDRRTHHVRLID